MNILPKKRWHVRTRDNIARVRRDEAAAAEEQKKQQQRAFTAEKEARVALLRERAQTRFANPVKKPEAVESPDDVTTVVGRDGHVNLFYELEQSDVVSDRKNADHEREAKAEREKEEMKIGYLTYLGQDTHELTGQVAWYNKPPLPRAASPTVPCAATLTAPTAAPLTVPSANPYLQTDGIRALTKSDRATQKKKKKKKEKKILRLARKIMKKRKKRRRRHSRKSSPGSDSSSSSGSDSSPCSESDTTSVVVSRKSQTADVEKLRQERLHRERVERERAAAHLARLRGEAPAPPPPPPPPAVLRKYNSQFNPDIARQNFP